MEVTATLQFTRPCLGNVRKPDCDLMQRDSTGAVIFMPTWWRSAFAKAARAIGHHYELVDRIRPALPVVGSVSRIRRWYGKGKGDFKLHEGFDVGAQVQVRFLLPVEMTAEQFAELLEATGEYVGVSPFGWRENYGLFRVLQVASAQRKAGNLGGAAAQVRQPPADHPGAPQRTG